MGYLNMSYIILSQKKDFKSEYKDKLFQLYHFPASYRSRINTGDIFIYNQGEQGQPVSNNIRYYYGTGIIGNIYTLDDGVTYFAELKQCKSFYNNVPLKFEVDEENEKYIEQLGYEDKRKRPNWQSSIRNLSPEAYKTIINMAGGLIDVSADIDIEAIRSDLKLSIDNFYLEDNHQSLVDVIALSMTLMQKYGVMVK